MFVVLAALTSGIIGGREAEACSCMPLPPPAATLVHTTAVFVGEARAVEPLPDRPGTRIAFAVLPDGVIKGVSAGTEVFVSTLPTGGQCGFPFHEGITYLVYATGEPDHLLTTACSRTRVYRQGGVVDAGAAAELAVLRRAVQDQAGAAPASADESPDGRASSAAEPAASPAGPPPATTPDKRGCAGCRSLPGNDAGIAGLLVIVATALVGRRRAPRKKSGPAPRAARGL